MSVYRGGACPDCKGTGHVDCELCGGNGTIGCDACHGNGLRVDPRDPKKGPVPCSCHNGYFICGACSGGTGVCGRCNGSGMLDHQGG